MSNKNLIKEAKRFQKLAGLLTEDPIGQNAAGNPEEEASLRNSQIKNEEDTYGDSQRNEFVDEMEQQIRSAIGNLISQAEYQDEDIRKLVDQILGEILYPKDNNSGEELPF